MTKFGWAIPLILVICTSCASVFAPLARPDVKQEAAALRPGTYSLDTNHAALIFEIDHLGFSTYVGRFEKFDASLDFDAATPQSARVDAVIDMKSLNVAHPDFAATLMGTNWFDADRFPQASFKSTSIAVTGPKTGRVTGDLTLHGVTKPVTLDVTFNGGGNDVLRAGYIVGFSATATLNRGDFGIDRFSGLLADEVRLRIETEFKKE